MSVLLYILTIILCFTGVGYSLVYLWLNSFSSQEDDKDRNAYLIGSIKGTMILSMIFILVTGMITKGKTVPDVVDGVSSFYTLEAIVLLSLTLVGTLTLMFLYLLKRFYTIDRVRAVRRFIRIAVVLSVITILLSWIISNR